MDEVSKHLKKKKWNWWGCSLNEIVGSVTERIKNMRIKIWILKDVTTVMSKKWTSRL